MSSVTKLEDLPKMQYVRFGNTGMRVSKIALGCMSYGSSKWSNWVKDEAESIQAIKEAYELGINFFDTANMYSDGLSEVVLGKALRELNVPRGRVVIATKVFAPVHDTVQPFAASGGAYTSPDFVNRFGLSRKHIFDSVEASLKRLGVDYIDLYQVHRLDTETPMEEIMEALNDLVRSGKVRYIGASAMFAWQFQKDERYCRAEEEREMIPYCLDAGIAGIPYSPLASGEIVGKTRNTKRSEVSKTVPSPQQENNDVIVDRIEELAKKYNATNAQIALAWHFANPYCTSPIVGVSKVEQLYDLIGALDIRLTEEEAKYLEEPYIPRAVTKAQMGQR